MKRVVVTAGASGIGFGIAEAFLQSGARVHVCDISPDAVKAIGGHHPNLTASVCDVGNSAHVAELAATVEQAIGGLDVLVNNAGIGGPRCPVDEISDEDWDATFRVNLTGALESLTMNLARELGPFNIRCNALLPGSIENERGRKLLADRAERDGVSYEQALSERLRFISMRSRIDISEIGETAVFLASNAARHITGQRLSVCGNAEWEI